MSKVNCPHCEHELCIDTACRNVESYGSQRFNFKCESCFKMFSVGLIRTVVLQSVRKEDDEVKPSFG